MTGSRELSRGPPRRPRHRWPVCLLALLSWSAAAAELDFVWEDAFDAAERARLEGWIRETQAAVERLVGPFPMPVTVHLHRRASDREPVPWAHTRRWRGQAVHFHVDTRHPPEAFRRDWTAPHELSHLILPYLGRRAAWFAEGFASYMQYQVMIAMGVLDEAEAGERYRARIGRASARYPYPRLSFVEAAPRLREDRLYPVMYWGGATYFLRVDQALRREGSSLPAVLRRYLACCRRDRQTLDALLGELDRLAPAPVFTGQYRRLAGERGFPALPDD
ncbi:MAG TPA: hypothetical protein VF210_21510 [Pseudomonadales bacterium]